MINKETEKELLSPDEASSKLKITKRTILRWAREGKIECVRISAKVVLFTAEAFDRFVDSRTFEVESPVVNHRGAGRKMASPKPMRKGADNRTSGELWKDLRKEVKQWQ
jgi:excisionase family DNA binding protein